MVLDDVSHLVWVHSSETEHSDLVSDVLPIVTGSLLSKTLLELCPHGNDPVGHPLHIHQPLGPQPRVSHHLSSNPCPVPGRVGVHGSHYDLSLALHPSSLLLTGAAHSECPSPLSIETHVLGKTLREQHSVAISNKLPQGKCISVNISTGKTLVSHIKEGKNVSGLDDRAHLLPLLRSRVHTSRI